MPVESQPKVSPKNYIPFSGYHGEDSVSVQANLESTLDRFHLDGTEIYMAHIVPREEALYKTTAERERLVHQLKDWRTRRIHCSYWAEPSDFLEKVDYQGLVKRFGGEAEVAQYYGDLTGEHMFDRWTQEYELAREINAEAITFHLIDYFHIDGQWQFSNSRDDVLKAMGGITQRFLDELEKRKLLDENSPLIELENAGFGLEYGVQRADDFTYIFDSVQDPHGKLRIAWDINHLLHAMGIDPTTNKARFFLQDNEITQDMRSLEQTYGDDPQRFAEEWVALNILDPKLTSRVSAIHLSDNTLKTVEFFRNGQLTGEYLDALNAKGSSTEKEDYGVGIVLTHYDSHEPLGVTLKNFPTLLSRLLEQSNVEGILHELKNHELDHDALETQFASLGKTTL